MNTTIKKTLQGLLATGLMLTLIPVSFANSNNALQQAYKSTNIKSALINVCKTETTKGGKLTPAEVNKFCTCQVEIEGKMTTAQKWEVQSAINAKKQPHTLAVIQQQNKDLQACFGTQLTSKLQNLTEQAIKSSQSKK